MMATAFLCLDGLWATACRSIDVHWIIYLSVQFHKERPALLTGPS
eukprot:SAG11_NODE_3422_length_2457_cov_1.279050_3_plen_44_part_01